MGFAVANSHRACRWAPRSPELPFLRGLCLALFCAITPLALAAEDLDAQIESTAEQLVENDAIYKDETFRKLAPTKQGLVKLIDRDQIRIALYKVSINELKREPSLTHEQLRWLAEIEDLFVKAEGRFRAARAMYILSDESSGYPDRWGAQGDAIRNLSQASQHFDKAKRDHATLRMRVRMQATPK